MAGITLNILKPSVNNLTVRIFVRAAGLEHEEVDVWGQTATADFLAKDPAHLTPMIEDPGLPRGSLWESCAIMQYLCNRHGLEHLYPSDPGHRAMNDSAMFYLIGTLYPLLARATYATLSFPGYPGEVGTSEANDELKAKAQQDATAALAEPIDVYRAFFLNGRRFIGGDQPSIADIRRGVARVPARDRLRVPAVGGGLPRSHGGDARGRVHRAGGRRARLHPARPLAGRHSLNRDSSPVRPVPIGAPCAPGSSSRACSPSPVSWRDAAGPRPPIRS
ncbi:MAG TPA: glutathione S-transferase family protein [Gaiellales bacterium]|jgi:glutathione S-transferase